MTCVVENIVRAYIRMLKEYLCSNLEFNLLMTSINRIIVSDKIQLTKKSHLTNCTNHKDIEPHIIISNKLFIIKVMFS